MDTERANGSLAGQTWVSNSPSLQLGSFPLENRSDHCTYALPRDAAPFQKPSWPPASLSRDLPAKLGRSSPTSRGCGPFKAAMEDPVSELRRSSSCRLCGKPSLTAGSACSDLLFALDWEARDATCSVVSEGLCSLAPTRWPNPKPAE